MYSSLSLSLSSFFHGDLMWGGKWFNKCIKMNFYLFSHNDDDDDDQFICYNECMLVSPLFFFVYLFIFEKEDCQLYKLKAAISAWTKQIAWDGTSSIQTAHFGKLIANLAKVCATILPFLLVLEKDLERRLASSNNNP